MCVVMGWGVLSCCLGPVRYNAHRELGPHCGEESTSDPSVFGHKAFGYGVWVHSVQGCCFLTPVDAVALLAMPVCLPVAGVRDRVGAGADWDSGASARGLERPCIRYRSFKGTPSSESDEVLTPLTPSCSDRYLDALDLGESRVRRPGASFGFVGEYSSVASIGCSLARFSGGLLPFPPLELTPY